MIRSLVVEDELVPAEALVEYTRRLPGFETADHVSTGGEALQRLATGDVDLVLLDIYLPDTSGLDVLRRLRGAGNTVDVIAITRARDLTVLQAAMSFGVVQYLVKPFTFNVVRQRLQRYQDYRLRLADERMLFVQEDVDDVLTQIRGTEHAEPVDLPKGISQESLRSVIAALRASGLEGMSADEMARSLHSSRITARRYLEYLVESHLALRSARYQRAGRPQVVYAWRAENGPGPGAPDDG